MPHTDLILVAGARPNFVKLAPLHRALRACPQVRFLTVHTGQHYDEEMSGSFFRELDIPEPEINLEVGSDSHARQTAAIMMRLEPVLLEHRPAWVVVFGDVNSTVAAALVAAKLGIRVAHVEAGLRSGDWSMPEEINRVVTDRLADRLYTPSADADDNLRAEGIPADRIRRVGNIMVDSLLHRLPRVPQAEILAEYGLDRQRYVLVTLHRPSNVDDPAGLERLARLLAAAADREPVLFPMHPRTAARVEDLNLMPAFGGACVLPALPYGRFLALMANARAVVTDSGGVQEETTALGVPCLTLRENTERPVTILEGTNRLVPAPYTTLTSALQDAERHRGRVPTLWDGRTGPRIAEDLVAAAVPPA